MTALCLVVAVQALREYTSMTMAARPRAERAGVVLIGTGLYLALSLRPDLGAMWLLDATIAVAILILVSAVDLPAAGRGSTPRNSACSTSVDCLPPWLSCMAVQGRRGSRWPSR